MREIVHPCRALIYPYAKTHLRRAPRHPPAFFIVCVGRRSASLHHAVGNRASAAGDRDRSSSSTPTSWSFAQTIPICGATSAGRTIPITSSTSARPSSVITRSPALPREYGAAIEKVRDGHVEEGRPSAVAGDGGVRQPAARVRRLLEKFSVLAGRRGAVRGRGSALHAGREPADARHDQLRRATHRNQAGFTLDSNRICSSDSNRDSPSHRARTHRLRTCATRHSTRCSRAISSSSRYSPPIPGAVAGKDTYDDEYHEKFLAEVRPILEKRITDSIATTAALIVGAWEQAGRPAPKLDGARTVEKVKK